MMVGSRLRRAACWAFANLTGFALFGLLLWWVWPEATNGSDVRASNAIADAFEVQVNAHTPESLAEKLGLARGFADGCGLEFKFRWAQSALVVAGIPDNEVLEPDGGYRLAYLKGAQDAASQISQGRASACRNALFEYGPFGMSLTGLLEQ